MRINFSPSDTLKERLGHVAVGALLALLFWTTYACGDHRQRGEQVREPARDATAPLTQPSTPVSIGEELPAESPIVPREVAFEEAESAYREKQYVDAVSLFTAYTEQKPEDTWGHYMLGLSAWKSGEYETAERAFERALERDPEHVKSLINLSRVFLEKGRAEDAVERIQEALLIDGESGDAFRLLGRARHQLGLVEEAIDAYWEAIVLDDGDVWSMNNLGYVLIMEGRFEDALPPLARATELRQDISAFQNNLGIALERTGHFHEAAEAYRAALDADSTHEKASVNLARVAELEDDPEQSPVDLAALALQFIEEVERVRQPVTAEVPETMAVPDSTQVRQDETEHPLELPWP